MSDFLLYGVTGYTGGLLARQALARGLKPLLAGRDVEKTGRLAAELGLEWRAFRLSDQKALDRALGDTGLVLLAAGPYIRTSQRVVEGCLRTSAHYLDITGELDVYEALAQRDAEARAAGVMLGTGMGFDVVPTDCLALQLNNRLPGATDLQLAFQTRGPAHASHGTLKSGLEQIPNGLRVRRAGRLVRVPYNEKSLLVDFGRGPRACGLFGWGDVVTAWHSTGIPNIEVYTPVSPVMQRFQRLAESGGRFLGWPLTRAIAHRLISLLPNGSSEEQRQQSETLVWGRASDPQGAVVEGRLRTPEAYAFTACSAILAVEKVLAGQVKPGFQTPSMAFGERFVEEIEGVTSASDRISR